MKTTLTRVITCFEVLAVMTLLALPSLAAKPGITATLEPSEVAAGETAQLTVTVTGGADEEPALPNVDGLEFTPTGQSSEYQSINGVVTASNSQIYLVTATRAGTFTIPALRIGDGNDAVTSQPLVLHVTGTSSATAPHAPQQPAPALPSPNVASADDDQAMSANGQQAFLRLVTPKHEFHVGELVPVQIKAYFRGDLQASLDGLPTLSSDAFTLNSLDDKPAQTEEEIDGQPYAVLTWTTALSAVKAGDYSLSLEMPVVLKIHEKARKPSGFFGDSFFGDPFFNDAFGESVDKTVTLKSVAQAATAQPLPTANRPADFNGAVGQFTVTAAASPDHVTAGDPITLRLTVTGRGNFDRVSSGLLSSSSDWKTYKPVARSVPADSVGSEGTTTFEQAIVPMQAGHVKIPPLSFSYFDPEASKYVTRTTAPISIEVAPAVAGNVAAAPVANPSTAAPATTQTSNVERPEFAPNRVEPGHFTLTLRPLFLLPRFLIANFLAWIGLTAAFYSLRRRAQLARDPRLAQASEADRAIREQLAAMDSAMQCAETAAFFAAARRVLQYRLGERWGLPPETITLAEINARLNGEADGIRPVFQMADQVAYSSESLPVADLAGWKHIVTEQLKQMDSL
jgi:hypothetical protein